MNIHKHFKGATSFAMWIEEARKLNGPMPSFDGRTNTPETELGMKFLLNGDTKYVEDAQKLVKSLTLGIETPHNEWRKTVAGSRPNVQAYLAGQPRNMWRMKRVTEDHAPIKVFFGLTSSAMIDEKDLIKRGCALAAFVIAMSNIRPVVVVPFVTLGSYSGRRGTTRNMLISWSVSTQPLILSELMSLTRPEVTRHIGIEACRHLFGQEASRDPSFHADSWDEDKMRVHLNAKPQDLYLPCLYGLDPMIDTPVKWVQENIDRFTSGKATNMAIKPKAGEF